MASERRPLLASQNTSTRTSSVVTPEPTSSFSCRSCLKSYVPIEVLLFGYTISRVFVITLTGFFFFDQASHTYGDPSMDSLNPCGPSGHSPDKHKAEEVQKYALQLSMVGAFCDYMTAVIPTVFIGPITDRLGRRIGFVLPLLGSLARAIVFLLVLATKSSVYYVYIGYALEGLGGGFGAFFMTTFSAVADVTRTGPQRALRICINEAVIVLGSALASFAAGQWRRNSDYTKPVLVATSLGIITLIYALWVWPETRTRRNSEVDAKPIAINSGDRDVTSGESSSDVSRSVMARDTYASVNNSGKDDNSSGDCRRVCATACRGVFSSWRVYFRSDATSHPARRSVLALCFGCFLLTVAVNFSKPNVETVYRMGHLCWSAVKETEFDCAWLVSHWLCILLTLHVLQHRLRMSSTSLAMIGCASAMAAVAIFSLATVPDFSDQVANVLVFVSAASGTLARLLIPMLRAISSSVVNVDEQGALFASYACVELSGAAVFDLAASQVYKVTVHVWPGIVFVIMTSFFVVVMILLVVLRRLLRRPENSGVTTHYSSINA